MDPYLSFALEAMQTICCHSPRSYQVFAIPHLLKMMTGDLCPAPVLMVQSTGSGKRAVPLTASVVDGGVSIIVENTLALGSDQASKVMNQSSQDTKYIKSYHLDLFKSKEQQQKLCVGILHHLQRSPHISIILFTSPETYVVVSYSISCRQRYFESFLY